MDLFEGSQFFLNFLVSLTNLASWNFKVVHFCLKSKEFPCCFGNFYEGNISMEWECFAEQDKRIFWTVSRRRIMKMVDWLIRNSLLAIWLAKKFCQNHIAGKWRATTFSHFWKLDPKVELYYQKPYVMFHQQLYLHHEKTNSWISYLPCS